MNTQIIAIANQKGGVGKTTTCANLGIGLAQVGKKVLLIDGDPQSSLTISLGHPQPDKLPFTLSDAMGRILMDEPLRPGEGILHHPEGVDLMPADIQLSGMEVSLVNAMSRETILRQYLDTLKGPHGIRECPALCEALQQRPVLCEGLLQPWTLWLLHAGDAPGQAVFCRAAGFDSDGCVRASERRLFNVGEENHGPADGGNAPQGRGAELSRP